MQFTDQSYDENGTVVAWIWDFGDGATSTEQNPTHTYAFEGTYTASLTVTDNEGCTDSAKRGIIISASPPPLENALMARYTYSRASPQAGKVIQFMDASYGTIVAWLWDFGDGTTGTEQNPTHVYASEGTYTVSLTVINDLDFTDTLQASMRVFVTDYTIRFNESTGLYEAENSAKAVEFSNIDATLVIQYAIDEVAPLATSTTPKNIFIEDGSYDLTYQGGTPEPHSIIVSDPTDRNKQVSYINIEGASWNTIIKTNDGPYNAFYFRAFDPPSLGCRIATLQIDGGSSAHYDALWNAKNAIQLRQTHQSVFENLWIHHMGRTGMYNIEGSVGNEIRNNLIEENNRFGTSIGSGSTNVHHHHNIYVRNARWGLNWDSTYGVADYLLSESNVYIDNGQTDIVMFADGGPLLSHGEFRREIINSTLDRPSVYLRWIGTDVKFHSSTIIHQGTAPAVKMDTNPQDVDFYYNLIYAPQASACIEMLSGTNVKILGNKLIGVDGIVVGANSVNTVIGQLTGQPDTDKNDFSQISGTHIDDNGVNTQIGDNILP